jgi:hypothetical protein
MGAELVTELATGGNGGKGTGESATRESGREHHTRGPQAQVRGVLKCMEMGLSYIRKFLSDCRSPGRRLPLLRQDSFSTSRFFLHVYRT